VIGGVSSPLKRPADFSPVPAVLLVLTLAGPGTVRCGAAPSEITTRLEAPGALSSRFLTDTGTGRVLFVDIRDPRRPEKDFTALGFGSPALTLGPVDQGGLFREIGNPLGYGAGSPVFEEETRLTLRTGMDRSSRLGVWVAAPDGLLGVGGFLRGGEDLHAAASLALGGRGEPRLSALVMASCPDPGRVPDEWFPDRPVYPGGALLHLAAGARVPLDTLTGADTSLGLSFGISRGARVPSSGFVHLRGFHRSALVEAGIMAGTCGAGYVTPAGTYPSDRGAVAAEARLFPRGTLSVHGRLRSEGGRAESLPGRRAPGRRDLEGGLDLRGRRMKLSLAGAGSREISSGGTVSRRFVSRASAACRGKTASLEAGFRGEWNDGAFGKARISWEAEFRPRGWELGVQASGEWKPGPGPGPQPGLTGLTPEPEISGGIRGALARRGTRIEAELQFQGLSADPSGIAAFRKDPIKHARFILGWRIRR